MSPIRKASQHRAEIRASVDLRCAYLDLDGTLLGPGGTLFATGDGPSGRAARAIVGLHRAGVEMVIVSGRIRAQTRELARVLGASAYASEMGTELTFRENGVERTIRPPALASLVGTPHAAILRTGAGGFLLDRFAGRLEPHAPWAFLPRDGTLLLRGAVATSEVDEALAGAGYGWLHVLDNGILSGGADRWPHLGLDEVRAYHLVPRGVGKDVAIAMHRLERGLAAGACVVIGDSPSDLAAASEVGVAFIVAGGEPAVRGLADLPSNAFLLDAPHGDGVAEALSIWLDGHG